MTISKHQPVDSGFDDRTPFQKFQKVDLVDVHRRQKASVKIWRHEDRSQMNIPLDIDGTYNIFIQETLRLVLAVDETQMQWIR